MINKSQSSANRGPRGSVNFIALEESDCLLPQVSLAIVRAIPDLGVGTQT